MDMEEEEHSLVSMNDGLAVNQNPKLQRQVTYFEELESEKKLKLASITLLASFIIILFICGKKFPNVSGYHLISIFLGLGLVFWVSYFLLLICTFDHLHCIIIKRRKAPNAKYVYIPYGYLEQKSIPMSSISMMASMKGSNIERINIVFFYVTFGVVIAAIWMKWCETTDFGKYEIELILLSVSVFCAFVVPAWELEPDSKLANIMHYLFSTIFCIFGPIAFALNQNWSAVSVFIMIGTYTSLIVWLVLLEYVQRTDFTEKDAALVHKYSLLTLLSEFIASIFFYSSFVLFIYCMDSDIE